MHVLRVEVVVELNSGFGSVPHAVLQTLFTFVHSINNRKNEGPDEV